MSNISSIPIALDALRSGKFVIVVDDEDRENEGDLVMAAEHVTEDAMAFVIRYTGGVVCMPVSNVVADQLELPPMVEHNTQQQKTQFTVSIEAAEGISTGVSAHDRAKTIRTAINPVAQPGDLRRPGHVFPLRAHDGGVLWRAGHTEASVDLSRLAGLRHGAIVSELINDDGNPKRMPDLEKFAKEHNIPLISIADLIAYRRQTETFIRREAESDLETQFGNWRMIAYHDLLHGLEHVALTIGDLDPMKPILVRVHSECLTGDAFGSLHCDCGDQLHVAMQQIQSEGTGVVLYMRQEGRGIGLTNKIKAYNLQQTEGLDTVEANEKLGLPADLRDYGIGAQILKDLGVGYLRLLTNNPKKVVGLEGYGLHLTEQVPLECTPQSEKQKKYLQTKKTKLGHALRHV